MATIKVKVTGTKLTVTVQEQHDWISLNLGNGRRLTASFSGYKAAGVPDAVFQKWIALLEDKKPSPTFGERIRKFAADINTIWPEWNAAPVEFKVGQKVKCDLGKRHGGLQEGVVKTKRGHRYVVDFPTQGSISIPVDMLTA